MFKLLYLKLSGHTQLGNIELPLVEQNKIDHIVKPFSSVIIGANGTGKSFILRTIAEIFRQFNKYQENNEKELNLPFNFHLRYMLNENIYEIVTRSLTQILKGGREKRNYLYFKNRPEEISFIQNTPIEKLTGYEISLSELVFPENIIVSSIMLNDRFTFADSAPEDFYQYLGIRRTRSITSTQTFSKKTIRYLFDAKRSKFFTEEFSEMLDFMGFEKFFKVHYNTKYNTLFFSGHLTLDEFHNFFTEWWKTGHTKRKETNPLWGLSYYKKLVKEKPYQIEQIIEYLNNIVKNEFKFLHKPRSKSKRFEIDFFDNKFSIYEYDIIEELVKLDILNLEGIKIKKKENEFSIEQSSSGEYHLIISLLGIYSKIKKNSLILIDEPEISLHPNWQMLYIHFLKKMFRRFSSCHFILTTHSHFLISDLEGDNSSVISLTRDLESNTLEAELFEGKDTYNWSAEDILYRVFNVKTTRNYYIEEELRELLYNIAHKSGEKNRMIEILNTLKKLKLNEADPMNLIIEKAENYLKND